MEKISQILQNFQMKQSEISLCQTMPALLARNDKDECLGISAYRNDIPSITNTLMKFKDQLDPIPVVDTNASINSLQEHTKMRKE